MKSFRTDDIYLEVKQLGGVLEVLIYEDMFHTSSVSEGKGRVEISLKDVLRLFFFSSGKLHLTRLHYIHVAIFYNATILSFYAELLKFPACIITPPQTRCQI